MNPVIESWQILKRRWLPATMVFGVVISAASFYNSWQQPVYEAKGKILFTDRNKPMLLTGSGQTNLTNTPAQLIRSQPLAQATVTALKLDRTPNQILENLSVSSVGTNDVLELGYRDPNPQQAARIVQKLMEVYLQQDLYTRRQAAKVNRAKLEQQLPTLTNAVRLAEFNLRKFKEEFRITNLPAEKTTLVNAIGNLQSETDRAIVQLAEIDSQSQSLQQVFGQDAITVIRSSLVSESPGMQRALAELQGVEQRLALERTRFKDGNPVIEDLKSKQTVWRAVVQRESQQSLIGNNQFRGKVVKWQQSGVQSDLIAKLVQAETQRDGLGKRITALKSAIAEGRKRLAAFPQIEEKMRLLERDLKTATTSYEQLAARLKSAQTAESQAVPLAQIVSPAAVPDQPLAINRSINPFWSILTGLLLGGGVAWSLDKADKRLKNAAAAQKITNYPILGCIPNLPKLTAQQTAQLLASKGDNPGTEPFRMLQSNLKFLNGQRAAQVIVIASAMHQEGTSTVAARLAIAAAQTGQRVLLVDTDLRHPQQHEFWQVSNSVGLSNVLGRESQFPESIVEVADNLDLLPSGPTHSNPLSLFSSPAMAELVTHWFSLYDLVLLDATPLTTSAESILLSKMADGLVLVVRPQVVEEAALKQAHDLVAQSQQQIMGMVLNGVESHEHYQLTPATNNIQPQISAGKMNVPQLPAFDEFTEKSVKPRL